MVKFSILEKKLKNFITPFYGWVLTASRLQFHYKGGSLRFTCKFQEIPSTHFIDYKGWKAELTVELPFCFEHRTPVLEILCLNHYVVASLLFTSKSKKFGNFVDTSFICVMVNDEETADVTEHP